MVQLDKEIVIGEKKDEPAKKTVIQGQKEIGFFAQRVLKKMQKEQVVPTPYNFQIYFETMLDSANEKLKRDVEKIRDSESSYDSEDHHIQLEKDVKDGFGTVKNMIQSVATTYKNISAIKQIIKQRVDEFDGETNPFVAEKIMQNLERDVSEYSDLIDNHLDTLKKNYQKAVSSLKSVDNATIYDTRYNIYNKKHILFSIRSEISNIITHNYSCSLMAVKIKNSLLYALSNDRDRMILKKNISKLLQKTSKRSDIVGHYGNGVFMMVMKYTDAEGAKQACERVSNMIYNSSFFIGEEDIEINMEIASRSINPNIPVEENIMTLLEMLPNSSQHTNKYIFLDQ